MVEDKFTSTIKAFFLSMAMKSSLTRIRCLAIFRHVPDVKDSA